MRSRMWCIACVVALLCGADFWIGVGASRAAAGGGVQASGSGSAAGPASRGPLRYRAVFLATPGYRQAMAWAAGSRWWVGSALPAGHRVFGHAVLGWFGGRRLVCLQPAGFLWSLAAGTDGVAVVGDGQRADGSGGALLWRGSPLKAVALAPAKSYASQALSVLGGEEVGWVRVRKGGASYAALWRGSARRLVNLNPKGFLSSVATGTDGRNQAGWGLRRGGKPQALFWSGTPASAVDINPPGFESSKAYGIWDGCVAGEARTRTGSEHAVLWMGASHRAVDLNPAGCWKSTCYAVRAGLEVGIVIRRKGGICHAAVWRGSAASFVSLQATLPSPYLGSQASAVGPNGAAFGFAICPAEKRDAAVEWTLKTASPNGKLRPAAAAGDPPAKQELAKLNALAPAPEKKK